MRGRYDGYSAGTKPLCIRYLQKLETRKRMRLFARSVGLPAAGIAFVGLCVLAQVRGRPTAPVTQRQDDLSSLQEQDRPGQSQGRAFYFTRAIYSSYTGDFGYRGGRGKGWWVDFPTADRLFMVGVRRLTGIDAYEYENTVRLDDPELRRFPFLYALEVGYMALTEPEIKGLRDYLLAGGFLVIDDFWGTYEWQNFEAEISRVLPEYPIVDIPMDHPLLSSFYEVDSIIQIPNVGQGRMGGPTWERDGYVPALKGIFDERDRLMVVINWNTDLGDAWEWADDPWYPWKFSLFAYQIGVNMIVYGMSH